MPNTFTTEQMEALASIEGTCILIAEDTKTFGDDAGSLSKIVLLRIRKMVTRFHGSQLADFKWDAATVAQILHKHYEETGSKPALRAAERIERMLLILFPIGLQGLRGLGANWRDRPKSAVPLDVSKLTYRAFTKSNGVEQIWVMDAGLRVAVLEYSISHQEVYIRWMHVLTGYRGNNLSKWVLDILKKLVKQRFPHIRWVVGEVASGASLKTLARTFGRPPILTAVKLDTNTSSIESQTAVTFEEAMNFLPPTAVPVEVTEADLDKDDRVSLEKHIVAHFDITKSRYMI